MNRQHHPVLVSAAPDGIDEILMPIVLQGDDKGLYNELWLQKLVDRCPSVLPIASIEAAFWPAAACCTELALPSGYLDNFLVTPLGDLIAVECKLWENPEARRKVIAQIIDYAKDLQALSYTDLQQAIRKARKEPNFDLFHHASKVSGEPEPLLSQSSFIDAVSRNLRRGRCLLVIAGDGITENTEMMVEFLQQHAGMHFALVLVQLAIHQVPKTDQLLVVPSIPLRTINIVRGIVQIDEGIAKILPTPKHVEQGMPTSLTEEEFYSSLNKLRSGTSNELVAFLKGCEDLQITSEIKKTLVVRMIIGDIKVLPFVISANGSVDPGYSFDQKDVLHKFARALSSAIPGTTIKETPKTWTVKKQSGSFLDVWDILNNSPKVRSALEVLNASLRQLADP